MNIALRKDFIFFINLSMILFLIALILNIPLSAFLTGLMGGMFICYSIVSGILLGANLLQMYAFKGLSLSLQKDIPSETKELIKKTFESFLKAENNRNVFDIMNRYALVILGGLMIATNLWIVGTVVWAGLLLRTINYNSCLKYWQNSQK